MANNKAMVDGKMLTEKTKEELIAQILGQYKTIEEQAARICELKPHISKAHALQAISEVNIIRNEGQNEFQ